MNNMVFSPTDASAYLILHARSFLDGNNKIAPQSLLDASRTTNPRLSTYTTSLDSLAARAHLNTTPENISANPPPGRFERTTNALNHMTNNFERFDNNKDGRIDLSEIRIKANTSGGGRNDYQDQQAAKSALLDPVRLISDPRLIVNDGNQNKGFTKQGLNALASQAALQPGLHTQTTPSYNIDPRNPTSINFEKSNNQNHPGSTHSNGILSSQHQTGFRIDEGKIKDLYNGVEQMLGRNGVKSGKDEPYSNVSAENKRVRILPVVGYSEVRHQGTSNSSLTY